MEQEPADRMVFWAAVGAAFPLAAAIFAATSSLTAPYGRHHKGAGKVGRIAPLPTRAAWALMESPALLLPPLVFQQGSRAAQRAPRALLLLFLAHYFHRALVYPLRMRPSPARTMSLSVLLSALAFNAFNAYIQARSLSQYHPYPADWLRSPPFLCGACIFAAGMALNLAADSALLSLRAPPRAASAYSIPRGGLFEYVSCPNYLGEITQWLGWALLTSSWAGAAFFLLTAANLVPRAIAHHRWYLRTFPNYPPSRRILLPFLF